MDDKDTEKTRADVVEDASGVVLEVGFGSGLNLPFYKNVSKLYAIDPSSELYNLAKERIRTAKFPVEHLNVSAENVPLASNSVDTIVSTWSLCSIPDLPLALKELIRVLKPEGKLFFIEHGLSPKKINGRLQKICNPFSKWYAGGCNLDRKMDDLITGAGFKILSLEKSEEEFRPLFYRYKGVALKK